MTPIQLPGGTTAAKLARWFRYLDTLRQSAVTNMFAAAPYLEETFDLSRAEAREVLRAWMRTFDSAEPAAARARKALEPSP